MKLTNIRKLPLSLAVWLARDTYDYNPTPGYFSATTLIKPIKQVIMSARVPTKDLTQDVGDRVATSVGTAWHDSIEQAWLDNPQNAMLALGYGQKLVDRLLVNPTPEEVKAANKPLCVYMEKRSRKQVPGTNITVGGKFDFVGDGTLQDFKSTGTYGYMEGTKDDDYSKQGSIYKWLNQDIIFSDFMWIMFWFTDWSGLRATIEAKKGYPPFRLLAHKVPLMSVKETEQWLIDRCNSLTMLYNAPEDKIPPCTQKELWQKDSEWKYYKNPAKTQRATRKYDNFPDAEAHRIKDGMVGIVKEIPGLAKKCNYCDGALICEQRTELEVNGILAPA